MPRYSARTTFTFKGDQVKGAGRAGAIAGVNLAMERLRGHSVERAPVDMGDLRESATVVPATENQQNPTAVLVFDVPYAVIQHEDESLHHTPGAAGEPAGEAKYVEKNYQDSGRRGEYRGIIAKGIQDALGRA